jgi:hypothetical protein
VDWSVVIAAICGVAAGFGLAVGVFSRRCEAEGDRRFVAGVEHGRSTVVEPDSGITDDEDAMRSFVAATPDAYAIDVASPAVANIRRLGRLRRWAKIWDRNDERREAVSSLTRRGVGM